MKATSGFVGSLNDVFAQFGAIDVRRMFGGYGVYRDGLMFALIVNDVLYLKSDEYSANTFTELGLPPFEYVKNGKAIQMSYYAAPEEIFDDPEQAKQWANRAFEAALRSRKPGKKS